MILITGMVLPEYLHVPINSFIDLPFFLPSLRNALIKVSGSWTVSETSFTSSMSCLRGLPQLSGDFFLFTIPKIVLR